MPPGKRARVCPPRLPGDRPHRFPALTSAIKPAINVGMSPAEIRKLRDRLGLTQEAFARLLGVSYVSVNKWENDASAPTGLSRVLLELLASALRTATPDIVRRELSAANAVPVEVIRILTDLERKNGS